MSMNRRDFLKTGAAACAALSTRARAAEAPKGAPNIVILFTDDQRFDTIRALGNNEIHTPNMDRLVARGTSFTQATIMGGLHGAICVPSRAMLHTGRTLFHLGGTGDVIPPEFASLPETLRAAGYRTYATGKWHSDKAAFNRYYNEGGPIFFGGMNSHENAPIYDYDPSGKYPKEAERSTGGKQDCEVYTDAAVRFLAEKQERPFFLYIAYTMPHDPRTPPEAFKKLYDPAKITLPPNFMPQHPFDNGELEVRDEMLAPHPRTPEVVRQHIADYYASISFVDSQIGRVIDALDANGKIDNTIIAFAGDNGLAVGQHGLFGKQSLYEHSCRVPLVLAGPGIPANARRTSHCYVHDLFPTLCRAANVPVPASVESRDLSPLIADEHAQVYDTTFHAYRDLQRAVRGDQHKLIEYTVGGNKRTQLFDIVNDPWELHDLAEAKPELVATMREQLGAWRARIEFA